MYLSVSVFFYYTQVSNLIKWHAVGGQDIACLRARVLLTLVKTHFFVATVV